MLRNDDEPSDCETGVGLWCGVLGTEVPVFPDRPAAPKGPTSLEGPASLAALEAKGLRRIEIGSTGDPCVELYNRRRFGCLIGEDGIRRKGVGMGLPDREFCGVSASVGG